MTEYHVDVTQTITTTYAVPTSKVADGNEAIERYAELGIAVHSETHVSDPVFVGTGE